MKTTRLLALAALGLGAACSGGSAASGGSQTPSPSSAPAPSGAMNAEVITQSELSQSSVADLDALDAVQRLRPRFFQGRTSGNRSGGSRGGGGSMGGSSTTAGKVSINGGPLVGTDELKKMRANTISEVRYLNPDDASQRFGSSAGNTFVLVVTLKS